MAITKVINSESQAYRPVLTDTLVLDAVPTVNSFNSVTSDAVARAVAGASGEVPQVTENDNGKVLKAIYDAGGPAVEWGESTVDQNYSASSTNAQSGVAVAQAIAAIPSASYTAGDGIDIDAQNAVSVKAGNGLSIGNASGQGQVQLSSSRVTNGDSGSYVYDICTLTSDFLDIICNGQGGLSVTLSRPVSFSGEVFVYPAICSFSSETGGRTNAQGVFGEAIYINRTLPAGTTLTFDASTFTNIEWIDLSYLQTLSDSELASYHLAILRNSQWTAGSFYDSNPTATSIDTATYTGTVTIQDALNVSNPLPTSAVGDAGKVLTVSAAGAAEWATPSGGGSSFTLTKVGTVTDYLPTTGGKNLSFTSVSGQSNFIDPTKLYILKVKVSCVDSGELSFGSAPYLTLSSFNTEYNAVNRTHLSYAVPQIGTYSMSDSASTNTPVYFFDEVANNLHIAPTGGQENDLKITIFDVHSGSANSHRITVDLYMVN